jgi:hypothetical protein
MLTLAAAAGLPPAQVHQITARADPGGDDDAQLDGRELICDRLTDEVDWKSNDRLTT